MKNDEGAIDLFVLQTVEQVVTHVNGNHIDACAGQRLDHGSAGLERNLTLGALAAIENSHATEVFHRDGRMQFVVCISSHFDFP
ncbi:hypothetical protein D3C77_591380 [compost metagenome]